jgi:heat shock protein beta
MKYILVINNKCSIFLLLFRPNDISDDEYNEFYKSLTKDHNGPLTKVHFVAEGEVTFKSVLFVPQNQPSETFNKYGSKTDNIKVWLCTKTI